MEYSCRSLRIIALVIVAVATADASPIQAKADILGQVDAFLAGPSWEMTFGQPTDILGTWEECIERFPCDRYETRARTEQLDQETVTVTSWVGTQGNPQRRQLKRQDWDQSLGNLVRMDVANKESYGIRMHLTEAKPARIDLLIDGEQRSVDGLRVLASGEMATGERLTVEYIVISGFPGLAQLVAQVETQVGRVRVVRSKGVRAINTVPTTR